MKTQIHIDDYKLKIENESMVVAIKLGTHEHVKEIFGMTKELVELSIGQSKLKETLNEIHDEAQGKQTDKSSSTPNALRTCPICGKEFEPRSIKSTYCSNQCASKGYNKKHLAKKKKKETTHHTTNTQNPTHYTETKAHYDPKLNHITGKPE